MDAQGKPQFKLEVKKGGTFVEKAMSPGTIQEAMGDYEDMIQMYEVDEETQPAEEGQ